MWIEVMKLIGIVYLVVSFSIAAILLPTLVRKRTDPDKIAFPKLFLMFSVGLLLMTLAWPILLLFLWTVKPEEAEAV